MTKEKCIDTQFGHSTKHYWDRFENHGNAGSNYRVRRDTKTIYNWPYYTYGSW